MPRKIISDERRLFAKRLRQGQTALETRLWHELRGHRLDGWKFRRQVPIEGYIADFMCHEARLVVDVDGPLHLEPERKLHDRKRDAVLREKGFRVMRFSEEVALGQVIDEIRNALGKRPSPGP